MFSLLSTLVFRSVTSHVHRRAPQAPQLARTSSPKALDHFIRRPCCGILLAHLLLHVLIVKALVVDVDVDGVEQRLSTG